MSIILGLGLPTAAAYIITATIAAPVLIQIGILPLAAHYFVFYFAIIGGITPPVAICAFVAAGIAKADPTKTAFTSVRLAVAGFILPFLFVYAPELLLQGGSVGAIVFACAVALVAITLAAIASEGFLHTHVSWWLRVILLVAGLGMIAPTWETRLIGLAVLVGVFLLQKRKAQKEQSLQVA